MDFDYIRINTEHETEDAQALARNIINPEDKEMDDHWSKTASLFLTGAILHTLHAPRHMPQNLSQFRVKLMEIPTQVLLTEMLSSSLKTISDIAIDLLNRPEPERGSILNTAYVALEDYQQRQKNWHPLHPNHK
jgi:type IV secretion system protein VirD4